MLFYVLWEPLLTLRSCWGSWKLLAAEISLRIIYLFPSPHILARRYMKQQNLDRDGAGSEHSLLYGHTPISTLEAIGKACEFEAGMVIYDVGCGAGYTCFYWRYRFDLRVLGVEINPAFTKRIKWCCKLLKEELIHAQTIDAREVDYGPADLIYLHGTSFTTELLETLFKRWSEELSPGTLIISVLNRPEAYGAADHLRTIGCIDGHFPWGSCPIYLCQVEEPSQRT